MGFYSFTVTVVYLCPFEKQPPQIIQFVLIV
jgi:hypothetical protein